MPRERIGQVIQSAGERLRDIANQSGSGGGRESRFMGQSTREEMIAFMTSHSFKLTATEDQNEGRQQNLTFTSPLG